MPEMPSHDRKVETTGLLQMAKLGRVNRLPFRKRRVEIGGHSADLRAGIRVMSHCDSTPSMTMCLPCGQGGFAVGGG